MKRFQKRGKPLFSAAAAAIALFLYFSGCATKLAVKPAPERPQDVAISTGTLKYGAQEVLTGVCEKVMDGDTIRVNINGREEKVRFYGIDTPESKQAYGRAARQFTAERIHGKTVTIYSLGREHYGRLLGVVEVDGQDLNLELVKAGYAWHYKQYSDSAELAAAEEEARKTKRGLWCEPNPQAPWDWRKAKRAGKTGRAAENSD